LTRTNLTAAEDRVRDLETAFSTLFPGIDLETLLSSAKLDSAAGPSSKPFAQPEKKVLPHKQQDHDQNQENRVDSALESLPREADGFDWSENAVRLGELSDGMAALSINPEGAGYLGKCSWIPAPTRLLKMPGATSSVIPLRALLSKDRSVATDFPESGSWHIQSLLSQQIPFTLPENTFVDAYFRCYHPTYPFLYEPLFRAQFEGRSPRPEDSWPILLNAVLALGAWCIGEDESVMDDYFDQKVTRFSDARSFDSGSLPMVQALLLLSNYTQKRNRPNTGWNYLGLAVRMAMSLGLHREFPDWEISMLHREMRRRVWWGLFIFDSGASITFGRPVLLPQRGIMDAYQVLNIEEEVS
jgi:transcriptional regulatory protein GAL4